MTDWEKVLIGKDTSLLDALRIMDKAALQILVVVDHDNKLLGTATDGDLRRGILKGLDLGTKVHELMNETPIVAQQGEGRDAIIDLMQDCDVHPVPLVDADHKVVGLFTLEDALRQPTLDNWAIIMAGGIGSRLLPLTENAPKPLLPVGERPILETILYHLKHSGFGKIMISVNYMANMIQDYFGDGSEWGVHIEYLTEEKPLGTIGALRLVDNEHPLMKQPFLLMNGDVLSDIDFSRIIKFNETEGAIATMCVREYFNEIPFGVVSLDDHKIVNLEEKPIQKFYINAGIYVLAPEIVKYIPKSERCDITEVFSKSLDENHHVAAYPITEYWRDVGTHEELRKAEHDYLNIFGDSLG